ncbi:hypothetical protein [Neomicrococcus lactis]|uniref:Uncharacterized protein n=1 Tax=Neomicrococcus lactis TaxID=732241 RepID=A0A7W8YAH2_9MICC|nr:hypothetical protein [Neomicrococcus lactis]MBB5597953.1 hypothetical protein [Neomicrococcus lactis]
MRRIEDLMKQSDPAQGLPAPGPLNLSFTGPDGSDAPTFAPTFVETADKAPEDTKNNVVWFKKPAVWIAGVAAAAAVGLVLVINPFQSRVNNPLPGVTAPDATKMSTSASPTQASESPSSGSSTPSGSSAAPTNSESPTSSAPASSGGSTAPAPGASSLPNGLVPAHENVFWEDSTACKAFEISKLTIDNPDTNKTELVEGTPEEHPVVGCYQGYAAFVGTTDRDYFAKDLVGGIIEGNRSLFIATWQEGKWAVGAYQDIGSQQTYPNWIPAYPDLRAQPFADPYPNMSSWVDATLKAMDVEVDNVWNLLGPNIPTWAPTKAAASWQAVDLSEGLGLTAEKRSDWTLVTKASGLNDAQKDSAYFFDTYGGMAVALRPESGNEVTDKIFGDAPYQVLRRENIELSSPQGPLAVALVQKTAEMKDYVMLSLIPQDLPDEGKRKDLLTDVELPNGAKIRAELVDSGMTMTSGVENYLANSQYWKDVVQFARSLRGN